MEDSRLRSALTNLEALEAQVDEISEEQWTQVLGVIRREIQILDQVRFFGQSYPILAQARVLGVIQSLIYHESDVGNITDISNWCLTKWLAVLHRYPREVAVLRGTSPVGFLRRV